MVLSLINLCVYTYICIHIHIFERARCDGAVIRYTSVMSCESVLTCRLPQFVISILVSICALLTSG